MQSSKKNRFPSPLKNISSHQNEILCPSCNCRILAIFKTKIRSADEVSILFFNSLNCKKTFRQV